MEDIYRAFYCDFDTDSKKIGSTLVGPDNIVGDIYTLKLNKDSHNTKVYLYNKFGNEVGYIDPTFINEIKLAYAKDFEIKAILSFVAYSDTPDPGHYWGQVAIFTYSKLYKDKIEEFVSRISNCISQGIRPIIDLNNEGIKKILNNPEWIPTGRVKLPTTGRGSTILKDHQTPSEKVIEKGRARNKGCYVISIVFIIAVIGGVIFFLLKMFNIL